MIEHTDFRDFSISNWYKHFENVALKTILVEIPEIFIEQFRKDEDVEEILNEECCEQFVEAVKNALNDLNRNAFVKNDWHAPMDAKMFSLGNSLQVSNIDEIMMYFRNSTIIQGDFMNAKDMTFHLALKKWANIHPAAEFRCIVINKVLRGITPRDWPTYYAHFNEEGSQIIEKIKQFFDENIKTKFFRNTYVFDIVLSYPSLPFILDFGPLNSKTNLYAFTWKEVQPLLNKNPEDIAPVFRFLESDIGIMTKSEALNKFSKSQKVIYDL